MSSGRSNRPALSKMQPSKALFTSPDFSDAGKRTKPATKAMTSVYKQKQKQLQLRPALGPSNNDDGSRGGKAKEEMLMMEEEKNTKTDAEECQARVQITIDRGSSEQESSENEGEDNDSHDQFDNDNDGDIEEDCSAASDDQGSPLATRPAFSSTMAMAENKDKDEEESASPSTPVLADTTTTKSHRQGWNRWLEMQSERVRVYNHGLDALVSRASSSDGLQRSTSLESCAVGRASVWPEWIQIHATTWNMNSKKERKKNKPSRLFVVAQLRTVRLFDRPGQASSLQTTSRSSSTTTNPTFM